MRRTSSSPVPALPARPSRVCSRCKGRRVVLVDPGTRPNRPARGRGARRRCRGRSRGHRASLARPIAGASVSRHPPPLGHGGDRDRRLPAPPRRAGICDRPRARSTTRCARWRWRPVSTASSAALSRRGVRAATTLSTFESGGRRMPLAAGLVIDATGRPSAVARRMGARRLLSERLVAERRSADAIHAVDRHAAWLEVDGAARWVAVSGVRSGRPA